MRNYLKFGISVQNLKGSSLGFRFGTKSIFQIEYRTFLCQDLTVLRYIAKSA